MRSATLRRCALGTLLLFAASCSTSQLPPISATGAGFSPTRDELRLWDAAREEEQELLGHVELVDDPELLAYLNYVLGEVTPPRLAANPHLRPTVHVIEDPTLNAFAYPHGAIYLHTGLLAVLTNEDQIATVLAHELSHVEGRHMIRHQRSTRNRAVGFSLAAVAAVILLEEAIGDAVDAHDWGEVLALDVFGQAVIDLGLQLALVASVNGYGRELEEQADEAAFAKLAAAGYDLDEATRTFETLLAETGEGAGRLEGFFFGSHPRLGRRVEHARRVAATTPRKPDPPRSRDADRFAQVMHPIWVQDLCGNLRLGREDVATRGRLRHGLSDAELPTDGTCAPVNGDEADTPDGF